MEGLLEIGTYMYKINGIENGYKVLKNSENETWLLLCMLILWAYESSYYNNKKKGCVYLCAGMIQGLYGYIVFYITVQGLGLNGYQGSFQISIRSLQNVFSS